MTTTFTTTIPIDADVDLGDKPIPLIVKGEPAALALMEGSRSGGDVLFRSIRVRSNDADWLGRNADARWLDVEPEVRRTPEGRRLLCLRLTETASPRHALGLDRTGIPPAPITSADVERYEMDLLVDRLHGRRDLAEALAPFRSSRPAASRGR
jgi:hypothetical protein